MKRQNDELITQSIFGQYKCIGKIISYIFSDEHIYIDKSFRKLLQQNTHGYVHLDDLIDHHLLQKFFQHSEVTSNQDKTYYAREAIECKCSELFYNLGRVRRKVPFNFKKFRNSKPICIEKIRDPLLIEDIRQYLGEHVYCLNQTIQSNLNQTVLVYSQDYRALSEQLQEKRLPFAVLDFEEFYKEHDLTQRLKERKLRSLNKPIEPPKRLPHDREGHIPKGKGRDQRDRDCMDEDYEYSRMQYREMMRECERVNTQVFVKIGRSANPEFNNQLLSLIEPLSNPPC